MKIIQGLIFATFGGLLIAFVVLYGIDRECARREHEQGLEAVDCIFESNCKFYNDQMKGDFFKG